MCRFLLLKSNNLIDSSIVINKFADLAEKSRSPDGDRQADGWGVAWIGENNKWNVIKSLSPIWKDRKMFEKVPKCKLLVAHARSASFAKHKNNIEFNQPYVDGKYAFVFNGLLRGVSVPKVEGGIGSEKIWNLLKQELKNNPPVKALANLKKILTNNSKEIVALNIGISDAEKIYSLCEFSAFADYYQLYYHSYLDIELVCSEKIVLPQ